MNNLVVLLACLAAVTCNDLHVGSKNGRRIFDQTVQASPAIWRQVQRIAINGSDSEVISQVIVTDHRPDKDGEAKIVEGGEGQKNVTIELQSPTVFRGFDFHVVVYAVQENVDPEQPIQITKDINVNNSSKPDEIDSVGIVTPKEVKPTVPTPVEDKLGNEEGKPIAPVTTGDQVRLNRNAEDKLVVDPIVQYVNEEKTTKVSTAIAPEVTTESAHDINLPVTSYIEIPASVGEGNNENKSSQTDETDIRVLPKDVPLIKDIGVKINRDISTTTYTSTETGDVTIATTKN